MSKSIFRFFETHCRTGKPKQGTEKAGIVETNNRKTGILKTMNGKILNLQTRIPCFQDNGFLCPSRSLPRLPNLGFPFLVLKIAILETLYGKNLGMFIITLFRNSILCA